MQHTAEESRTELTLWDCKFVRAFTSVPANFGIRSEEAMIGARSVVRHYCPWSSPVGQSQPPAGGSGLSSAEHLRVMVFYRLCSEIPIEADVFVVRSQACSRCSVMINSVLTDPMI